MHYLNIQLEASFGFTEADVEHDVTEGALRADVRKRITEALKTVAGLEVNDLIIDGWVN